MMQAGAGPVDQTDGPPGDMEHFQKFLYHAVRSIMVLFALPWPELMQLTAAQLTPLKTAFDHVQATEKRLRDLLRALQTPGEVCGLHS
jgi:hypothetical protein